MRWSGLPSDRVVAKLNFRPASVGAFANEYKVGLGYTAGTRDSQANAVDCFAKPNDWNERLGMRKQFEVRFRSNQAYRSHPTKKRFPVGKQFIGSLSQVLSRR